MFGLGSSVRNQGVVPPYREVMRMAAGLLCSTLCSHCAAYERGRRFSAGARSACKACGPAAASRRVGVPSSWFCVGAPAGSIGWSQENSGCKREDCRRQRTAGAE
ncbi:unnamed protein product [Prorocentrum cordatum]|uniref:Uncharacterized protein n=1 Tax=Prorocentrum cordatum TaxID=2364126 RepID=A0ABN9RQL9_9DINO|nr:unnamed protein product [Polarella glacialis]